MKNIRGKIRLAAALLLVLLFTACAGSAEAETQVPADSVETSVTETQMPKETQTEPETQAPVDSPEAAAGAELPVEGGSYYDMENVVLYLYLYGELPPNYITKEEAEALGWSGGSVEKYEAGAAIGGDRFGNREGLLPAAQGRKYTECDIDTLGSDTRGAKRLVFSNDGLYFYTADHYESFSEVVVSEDYTVEVR